MAGLTENDPLSGPIIRTDQPAPVEGQSTGYWTGIHGAFTAAQQGGLGASAADSFISTMRSGGPDNRLLSHDEAVKDMQSSGNYDTSVIPKDGIYQSGLDAIKRQQSVVFAAQDRAARSTSAGGVGQFVAGLVGGVMDPLFLALGPIGRGLQAIRGVAAAGDVATGASVGVRAVKGAATGGAVIGGYTEAQKQFGTAPGDRDITSYDVLRQTAIGMAIGGPVHAAFGPSRAMDASIDSVLQEEGGRTVDTGGATNMGISQKAHPNVDIANLTVSKARQIYKDEYWDKIDGDNLPANMQITALDAAVNQGVGKAQAWLKQANGDPTAFNALRKADYEKLAQENPAKYGKYLQGWLDRLGRVSLKSVNPYFAEAGGPTSSVLGHDMETVTDNSRWGQGATSRVGSRIEVTAPERGGDYSSVQADREEAQDASNADTLSRLGGMKLPEVSEYPGSVPLSVGESLRRFSARGYDNPVEEAAALPPEVKMNAAKTAVAQFADDSEVNVSSVIRAGLTGSVFGLEDAIPKSGSALFNDRATSEGLDRINAAQQKTPAPANENVEGENPELTQIRKEAAEATAIAEHAHNMAFGNRGLPFNERMANEIDEHANRSLNDDDKAIHDMPDLAKAIDAVVRCAVVKGVQ